MAVINGTGSGDFIHRNGDGFTGGGNEINTVTTGNDTISAAAGDDLVYADAGNDLVNGGDGNDTLIGGQGADTLNGGNGNDVIRITGISEISGLAEHIDGGNDVDTLDFQAFNAFGAVNLSAATITNVEQLFLANNDVTLTAAQLGSFSTILGSGAPDRLILSGAGIADLTGAAIGNIDEIRGSSGDDTIILTGVANGQIVNGLAGLDSLLGGSGSDTMDGGDGNDTLSGSFGGDVLAGGTGNDTISGDDGNDTLTGGVGVDKLAGGAGNDVFRINLVSDVSGLAETMDGGADNDTLDFQTNVANGVANISACTLTSIETLLLGGTDLSLKASQLGAFTAIAGSGLVDIIRLVGGGTADLTGANIVNIDEFFGSAVANLLNLTGVANGQQVDVLAGNDTVFGSLGADTIFGNFGNDTINGNEGNDTLIGGQGADVITGGIGNDSIRIAGVSDISGLAEKIDGGNDVDTLDFAAYGAIGRVNLTTVTIANVEILQLFGNDATMTAAQISGFESVLGSGLLDRIFLNVAGTVDLTGATVSNIDEFRGTAGNDTFIFTGVSNGQTINTLGGNDTVTGSDGNDAIDGGAGNDTIDGGAGSDIIVGGLGADSLTGGAGVDTFRYLDWSESHAGAGRDVITGFVHGQDILDLGAVDADLNSAGNQAFTFIGSAAFSNVAGQLRYAGGILSGDLTGDGVADFQIALTGNPVITASDIVL